MNLFEFYEQFPDETACRQKFREYREKQGVICKKCQNTAHYWKKDKDCFQCKKCQFRTTLRSGTVMHASKLSFQQWFMAMHLLTSTKKSFSAKEVQRQLGRKRYEPVWSMLHKLRAVMGLRDDKYKMNDKVEMDDAFFTVSYPADSPELEGKQTGRGTNKASVMVMTSYEEEANHDKQHKGNRPKSKPKYVKMKVMNSFKKEESQRIVKENMTKQAEVKTDKSSAYNSISAEIRSHEKIKSTPQQAGKLLPWVHIAIANAKRLLLDVHHSIDVDFLNNYLNEYCWKFNRRYMKNQFERLLVASVSYKWNHLGHV